MERFSKGSWGGQAINRVRPQTWKKAGFVMNSIQTETRKVEWYTRRQASAASALVPAHAKLLFPRGSLPASTCENSVFAVVDSSSNRNLFQTCSFECPPLPTAQPQQLTACVLVSRRFSLFPSRFSPHACPLSLSAASQLNTQIHLPQPSSSLFNTIFLA